MVKKSKLIKVIDWILNILLIIFLIGSISMILWKIFGNSPTDFQVISWVVGLFSMVIFKLFIFTYNMNREVGELKTGVRSGFGSVREDFRRVKEDIEKMDNSLHKVMENVHEIKRLVNKK